MIRAVARRLAKLVLRATERDKYAEAWRRFDDGMPRGLLALLDDERRISDWMALYGDGGRYVDTAEYFKLPPGVGIRPAEPIMAAGLDHAALKDWEERGKMNPVARGVEEIERAPGPYIPIEDRPALLREWREGRVTPEEYRSAPKRIDGERYPHLARAFQAERTPPEAAGGAYDPDTGPGLVGMLEEINKRTDHSIKPPAPINAAAVIDEVRREMGPGKGKKKCPECSEIQGASTKLCRHCGHRFNRVEGR